MDGVLRQYRQTTCGMITTIIVAYVARVRLFVSNALNSEPARKIAEMGR
jgi:hypothetical protein